MKTNSLVIFTFLIFFIFESYAHSGRTNSSGCHNNRKTGGYHCHSGSHKLQLNVVSNPKKPIIVPKNGKLTYLGNDWECKRGFRKVQNSCKKVVIPENGKLTYLGNDWECKRGFRKVQNSCKKVVIPENGKLTYLGNDWECIEGYYKSKNQCIKMTQEQLIRRLKQKEKMLTRMVYLSSRSVCQKAYDECISECPSSVYDWSKSEYLYNTDIKSKCKKACEEGKDSCDSASTSNKCEEFENECESECSSSVYNYASSSYLYNTDAESKCEEACEEGKDSCEAG